MEVKVIELSGKVEVQQGNKWVAVTKGQVLPAGSVISTGFKSEAILSFDETVIKVKALTRLTIEQLFEKNGDKASSVYLDTGSISADVKPAENKRVGFSVKTPAATASVRGTSGDVYSDGTVIGTSGRWCITPPEAKMVFVPVAQTAASSSEEETAVEGGTEPAVEPVAEVPESSAVEGGTEPVAEPSEGEPAAAEPVAETQAPVAEPAPVSQTPAVEPVSESVTVPAMEDFDFSYPDIMGAVYVSKGENVTVSGGSFVTPQENKILNATGSSGVQLLSETEKVVPAAPQVVSESSISSSTEIEVPEKPKYGTVNITVTLPSLN